MTEQEWLTTEQEWLTSTDPATMLAFLDGKASERKLRLFACVCCRKVWHLLADERSRKAVEVAERFADGEATAKERAKADADNAWVWTANEDSLREYKLATAVGWCVSAVARRGESLRPEIMQVSLFVGDDLSLAAQATLLRDISDNPFRPSPPLPPAVLAWHDGLVVRLAQAAYEERHLPDGTLDNSRLAVLADAVEEAGCTESDILGHLRGHGPHVRGCWAVDLILGKE